MSNTPENEAQGQQSHEDGIVAVGELLKASRSRSGQELRDVAQTLRIRYRYLEAIEAGDIAELPGKTYAIGFVRAYAEHLGLDGEEMVRRFKGGVAEAREKNDLVFPSPIAESGIPGGAILFVGLVVAALGYGIWYFNSTDEAVVEDLVAPVPERLAELAPPPSEEESEKPATEPAEQAPSEQEITASDAPAQEQSSEASVPAEPVAEAAPSSDDAQTAGAVEVPAEDASSQAAVTETSAPAEAEAVAETTEAAPTAAAPVVEDAGDVSRIEIRARINSWIQVRDDTVGRLLFTRLLRAGDSYHVPNRSGLRLLTGNAGALEILVDGELVPAIGGEGQVRRDVALDPARLLSGTAVLDN